MTSSMSVASSRGKAVPRRLLLAQTQVELTRYQEKCRALEERNEDLQRETRRLKIQLEAARRRVTSLQSKTEQRSPKPTPTPLEYDRPGAHWLMLEESCEITPDSDKAVEFPTDFVAAIGTPVMVPPKEPPPRKSAARKLSFDKSKLSRALSFDVSKKPPSPPNEPQQKLAPEKRSQSFDRKQDSPTTVTASCRVRASSAERHREKLSARTLSFERKLVLTPPEQQSPKLTPAERKNLIRTRSFERPPQGLPPGTDPKQLQARSMSFDRKFRKHEFNPLRDWDPNHFGGRVDSPVRQKAEGRALSPVPDGWPPGTPRGPKQTPPPSKARARAEAVAQAARGGALLPQGLLQHLNVSSHVEAVPEEVAEEEVDIIELEMERLRLPDDVESLGLF